jgi:hypothetical protein
VFFNLENTVWNEKVLVQPLNAAGEPTTFHSRNTVLDTQLMVYCESDRIGIALQKRQTRTQTNHRVAKLEHLGWLEYPLGHECHAGDQPSHSKT